MDYSKEKLRSEYKNNGYEDFLKHCKENYNEMGIRQS
jgi:hypothetical protein